MNITSGRVVTFIVGLVLFVAGLALVAVEVAAARVPLATGGFPPLHVSHFGWFGGAALLGAFIMEPQALSSSVGVFTQSVGKVIVVVLQALPGRQPTASVTVTDLTAKPSDPSEKSE